jgi:RNA polymerase sigma factor (TIGR02999 family)
MSEKLVESVAITQLLSAWGNGNDAAGRQVLAVVYSRLRKIARGKIRDCGGTIQPTELANELVAKLLDRHVDFKNRLHFFRCVNLAMRNLLLDLGRRKASLRNSENAPAPIELIAERMEAPTGEEARDLVWALDSLRATEPRAADVMELCYFSGLRVHEIATALDVSIPTVNRDLKFGRTWLKCQLQP